MDLFDSSALDGQWFVFRRATQEGDKDAEFKIRLVPGSKDREFFSRRFGLKAKADGRVDMQKAAEAGLDRACYALVDSRNATVPAKFLVSLPGDEGERTVLLDGKLTDTVKRELLGTVSAIFKFVEGRSKALVQAEEDDEEGKG